MKSQKGTVGMGNAASAGFETEGKITGGQLQDLMAASGMTKDELAHILNINPTTLTKWIEPEHRQSPTSTMFLVLFTMLVGKKLIKVPDADDKTVLDYLAPMLRSGHFDRADLKNPKVMDPLRREIAIETNKYLLASRKLLRVLEDAWDGIEGRSSCRNG